MKAFQTSKSKLPGTRWSEVYGTAFRIYKKIRQRTKRRPYIRSAYFKKDKIFLELFWSHLHEKFSLKDKIRRLKYYDCAIDLIRNSKSEPITKENPNRSSEIVHRFRGVTKYGESFSVQIKEEKRSAKKWLMSVYPN